MALAADIAEAVVAELNGHAFSLPFTAVRSYRPVYGREEMKALHVTVVAGGFTMEPAGRGLTQEDYVVEIGLQQAADPQDMGAMDALLGLVEEIVAFFRWRRPAACPAAICIRAVLGAGSDRGYAEEHVMELQQFTSILRLTFRVVR
jgi:hypothetical protein